MNSKDAEIVNVILAEHAKREKRKFKVFDQPRSIVLLVIFILAALIINKTFGLNIFIGYSVIAICFLIFVFYFEYSSAKAMHGFIWKQEDLSENDFAMLSKCSNEFKDNIKKEMAPDGSLMYISLEQVYRAACKSQENKSQRQKIEAILK